MSDSTMIQAAFEQFKEVGRKFDVVALKGHPGWAYHTEPWTTQCFDDTPWPPDAPLPSDDLSEQMYWIEHEGIHKIDAVLRDAGHEVVASSYFSDADLDVELGVTVHLIKLKP